MAYYVVYLQCKRYLVLPMHWIEKPVIGQPSKVFFSGDDSLSPDFTCEVKYYINEKARSCYEAFVIRSFESFNAAQYYASNKRVVPPIQYQSLHKFIFVPGPNPVDYIEISDSEIDCDNYMSPGFGLNANARIYSLFHSI